MRKPIKLHNQADIGMYRGLPGNLRLWSVQGPASSLVFSHRLKHTRKGESKEAARSIHGETPNLNMFAYVLTYFEQQKCMGQFDFTYADNGRNILRGMGYVYLTKEFAKRTCFPNPIRFVWTDDYGMFTFRARKEIFTLDIYAVYGCMAYLNMMETKPGYLETLEETLRDSVFRYIDLLMRRKFQRAKALEETLREFGIDTFFSGEPWKAWKT